VELYLYSPSGPSWPVLGRNLPFTHPPVPTDADSFCPSIMRPHCIFVIRYTLVSRLKIRSALSSLLSETWYLVLGHEYNKYICVPQYKKISLRNLYFGVCVFCHMCVRSKPLRKTSLASIDFRYYLSSIRRVCILVNCCPLLFVIVPRLSKTFVLSWGEFFLLVDWSLCIIRHRIGLVTTSQFLWSHCRIFSFVIVNNINLLPEIFF
jgi:hypothetical protein